MNSRKLVVIGGALIFASITILALFIGKGLTGESASTKSKKETISNTLLSCSSTGLEYPYFAYDNSDKKELSLDLIFSDIKLKAIYLNYKLYYSNKNLITASEAHNHAAMNISYAKNGLEPDALNASYAKLDDGMRFSIYLDKDQLNEPKAAEYFLINTTTIERLPETIEEYKNNYEKYGLGCRITN